MVQKLYPEGGAFISMIMQQIHTAKLVTEWFDEHESKVEHLPWPAQSPDLNIIETLGGVLKEQFRNCFLPPAPHSDLATDLEEEWLKIPLAT
ncbi:hypothetical protein R3I93_013905 [Phoxinus phoxinus]|uniref:Tc1-like transposase DDE domain-containing protein n=1 Tax=Phoxinus phoxinus TaxID=58324 RepID=A0AAN9CW10_9TELE